MPRLIDHDARSAEISAAAMRVLERDGLAGLSVRVVSKEAGIAVASLRRAFATQHELREHCLSLIGERAAERVRVCKAQFQGRELAERVLAEVLPVDEERRTELVAQMQLSVLALTDDRLKAAANGLSDGVRAVCAIAITALADAGMLGEGRDHALEVVRLNALLDGIAMRGVLRGEFEGASEILKPLEHHLDELSQPTSITSGVSAGTVPRGDHPAG
ncbi:TetR family transcriptional regulator [Leucobacter insecticola]|uniref:TetR family transcriptional regulator n=1 Tax=Leucobacter insecticola TaxID=2714934 RepID=A0A6G8FFT8_9MICO|nr:TetR family transcriptional regulator C-terminal domain-containing protein [Leucobacter insecticola]QIM15366.1 TetR family transcriptional regulator [Leucobacter insecticola]